MTNPDTWRDPIVVGCSPTTLEDMERYARLTIALPDNVLISNTDVAWRASVERGMATAILYLLDRLREHEKEAAA